LQIFNGNNGRSDIVKHNLVGIRGARFLRFQPTNFSTHKALRDEVYGLLTPAAPSEAPANFSVIPLTSTSVRASWQLPTAASMSGNVTGFKLLYRSKGSAAEDQLTVITIGDNSTLSIDVTGFGKFTEYEFQALAFSFTGNGPQSPVKVVITNEDVPSQAPKSFTVTTESSTSVLVSWQLPPPYSRNGFITGFKLFYRRRRPAAYSPPMTTLIINDGATITKNVTGLLKYTEYEFQVLAFTSAGDGRNSSVISERTKEDVPSKAPMNLTVIAASTTSIIGSYHHSRLKRKYQRI